MPVKNLNKTPIITVQNLVKYYGSLHAVKGISFEVFEGEIFGLLGPNGAGKSTTLEILETLRTKSSGKVHIAGYDLDNDPKAIQQVIGVQLQSSGYYPQLNLKELVNMFAGLYNCRVNARELLAEVGLQDRMQSFYKNLSGGQKQRFSLATTLINKPKIIFLDEPTTGLDPQSRRNLWNLVEDIRKKGTTVILTTHYMEEAETLCDRVAIMDQGSILEIGHPQDLIDSLLATGFHKAETVKAATLEDVFLQKTGHSLRE